MPHAKHDRKSKPMSPVIKICPRCGRPHDIEADKSPFCTNCILNEAEHTLARQQQDTAPEEPDQARRRKQIFWLKITGAAAIIFMLWSILSLVSAIHPQKSMRRGTYDTDRGADRCIANLWEAAQAAQQNSRAVFTCPVSGAPYRTIKTADNIVIECPNPQKHHLKRLYIGGKPISATAVKQ